MPALRCLNQLMKEGLSCQVSIWNDVVIDVTLPVTVEYVVVDTPPNFKVSE